jgi:hypothetical protein
LERVQPVAASPATLSVGKQTAVASPTPKPRPSPKPSSTPEVLRVPPETTPTPTSKASPTPFTLPPFEPSPRPKRPQ